jgi:quercetin dioxygenase-like cupin family protein
MSACPMGPIYRPKTAALAPRSVIRAAPHDPWVHHHYKHSMDFWSGVQMSQIPGHAYANRAGAGGLDMNGGMEAVCSSEHFAESSPTELPATRARPRRASIPKKAISGRPRSPSEGTLMNLQIRRVVTGHDAEGRAVVKIDELSNNVVSNRSGAESCVIWWTEGFPVDNDHWSDPTIKPIGTTVADGTVFRIVRYEPGVEPRRHRTDSVDYAVVLQGAIEMELDDQVVKLRAGDVLVQRGTVHNWVNRGPEVCVIAFVLVSAKPVTVGGKVLAAHG